MKIHSLYARIQMLALTTLFFMGAHTIANAQLTVFNGTGCGISVAVGQNDITTVNPCDLCPINPPTLVTVASGMSQPIFGQDVCGEEFGWIAWTTNIAANFGTSPNPGLFVSCVPNTTGPGCGIGATNALWLTSGSGPVNVLIF
ncbi:MAG: hypothetical protein P1U56_07090 [Saprospiraceae bacterium]|nr:hypothetical protein [Saprospiraceae bacterium]